MLAFTAWLALLAQRGDVKGEAQPPLPEAWRVPKRAALSPAEQHATFHVDAGLEVELVAAEPLVVAPVCASFDELGRLWVCEMRSYMRDIEGTNESAAENAVVVLTDRDGDGRMDERAVFLDQLALPRAVAPTRGGALVLAPPNLLFARDTDGDGRADDVRVMDTGLTGLASPEHAINGLLYTLDNHFACANAPWRYRWNGERLERQRTAGGGQWGITEDRFGRIFHNDNSNPLRCDLYPSHFAVRNPNLGVAAGMGVDIARGSRPAPSHGTPGVNRGYRGSTLVDGRLNEFTGACAPWIYEGDALPERYRGDAFVCEPCGNLVHRFEITYDERGFPKAESAPPDGAFLTSTDERFRPVHLCEGPDGALYVVDMYRGVLQHRLFVTSWLRAQVVERELEAPLDRGRIWRVTRKDATRKAMPDLANCSWTELAGHLGSTNRWMRKTAQRLFVEQGEGVQDARDVLTVYWDKLPHPQGTLNWLWARDGLDCSDLSELRFLLDFRDVTTRSSAAWLAASLVARGSAPALRFVRARGGWLNVAPELEQLVVLGLDPELSPAALGGSGPSASLAERAARNCSTEVERGAIASGLFGREVEFLRAVLEAESWPEPPTAGQAALVGLLAECVLRDGRTERVESLLGIAVACGAKPGSVGALLDGVARSRAKDAAGRELPLRVARMPAVLEDERLSAPHAQRIDELFIWPGKPGTDALWPRELTSAERQRFERGRVLFEQNCASCHQLSGRGDPALAPPLRNSRFVLGDPDTLVRIVAHGLRGPVTFDGTTWDGEMPSFAASDDELAGVLSYLRREWQHTADPLTPEFVGSVRVRHADRRGPWHVSELEK
ncbi:MAG: c-type cytochrome [Planctomycetes bacterium]|nr:c-type cytochrome [Planctomycetota bacterium]